MRRPSRTLRAVVLCGVTLLAVMPRAHAQRAKDPLTPDQEEQVRNVADQPDERVKLFITFIEERTAAIHHTVLRPETQHPGIEIHDNLTAFTSLVDELQDNLDAYDESHSDIRKSLKFLLDHAAKWPAILQQPPESPEYDFARKSALDSVESTTQSATELLKSQEEYFAKHKPEKATKKSPPE
jgi:exonuclease VII large subunit